jgi:hypothetical protein
MFFGKVIDKSMIFIAGTANCQIVNEKERAAASFFLVSDLAKTPLIIVILRCSEQIFNSTQRSVNAVDSMHHPYR